MILLTKAYERNAGGQVTGYVSRGLVYTKNAAATPSGATPPPGPLVLRDFIVHHTDTVAVATFFHDRDIPNYGQTMHQTSRSSETWIKRGTEWKLLASQGRQLMPDPPTITLSAAALNDYVGTYAAGSAFTVRITRAGKALTASINGEKSVPLYATVPDVFFTPGSQRIRLIFQRDANGRITGYLRRREERDLIFRKTSQKVGRIRHYPTPTVSMTSSVLPKLPLRIIRRWRSPYSHRDQDLWS
jgi:hypothetical protein